ncbi:MAG: ATP-binding cassette subfamily B protein [Bradymonadia bacterium]
MSLRSPLFRLFDYAKPHRARIRAAVTCSVLNKLFDLAPPALIGAAIDVVVNQEQSLLAGYGVVDVMDQLIVLTVLTFLIWGAESVFEYLYAILWRNLAQAVEHDLRVDAYAHVQNLELAYFEDRTTGGLMSILNDDINQLERFLDGGANQILQVGTTVLAVGATFFGFSPTLFVLSFLPVPVVLWGSFRFQARIAPRYAAVRARVSALNETLSNNLGGIATIKSFTGEDREVARVSTESLGYLEANREAIRLSSAFVPVIRMAIVVGFSATLVYGGHLTQTGELAVGAYSVLVFLTQRLLWPLTGLGQTVDLYQRAMASTERVLNLLDTPVGITSGPQELATVKGRVEFDDVQFSYSNGVPVIQGLQLVMPAGQTTAIVGATGSGKSTVIKLLLRFYDVTAGGVRVDGVDVREFSLASLRQSVGLVSQDVFLFYGTVRENIAYGRPDATDEEVRAAARVAEADGFIDAMPGGYETMVGERGQKLSGGQRQRISIARAVLKDPPILVLDEATSAVDNETEAAIQRSLETLSVGRTAIVIAHRLSTIRHADQIVVLDGGRVLERGTHDELLAVGGAYAGLWRVQTGERAE